jgi:hypothetical protein
VDPAQFEQEIRHQEDILYGVALFFECVSLIHAGQDAVIETYRKQFRNVIQTGKTRVQEATALLNEAKRDPAKVPQLAGFSFTPCQGYVHPDQLARRALALLASYDRLFPNRSRSKEFTEDEILSLIEASAEALGDGPEVASSP